MILLTASPAFSTFQKLSFPISLEMILIIFKRSSLQKLGLFLKSFSTAPMQSGFNYFSYRRVNCLGEVTKLLYNSQSFSKTFSSSFLESQITFLFLMMQSKIYFPLFRFPLNLLSVFKQAPSFFFYSVPTKIHKLLRKS